MAKKKLDLHDRLLRQTLEPAHGRRSTPIGPQVARLKLDEARRYAPVLERMVELCGSKEKIQFGAALEQAQRELKINVPESLHPVLLQTTFRIVVGGRIPGAPDA